MTPKEQAKELVYRFTKFVDSEVDGEEGLEYSKDKQLDNAKQCALIVTEGKIEEIKLLLFMNYNLLGDRLEYWEKVKLELHKI
jgi:hypothetical protein